MSCLEAGHPLLVIAAGVRGIAPVRAALSWTPVLAHAGSSRVNVFYIADSQTSAAYLVEWDMWREAGVSMTDPSVAGRGREHMATCGVHEVCSAAAAVWDCMLPRAAATTRLRKGVAWFLTAAVPCRHALLF